MGYDYDAVVVGGGAAGLTAASTSASLGAKTALVEADKLGGDSTWTGCVPSKTLIRAAAIAHTIRTGSGFGVLAPEPVIEFDRVMANVHRVREQIYRQDDSPAIYESLGVDVLKGRARFVDPHTLEIDGRDPTKISARNVFVATGTHPTVPPITGLEASSFCTSETIFDIDELPRRLAIVGGGPAGCELGQAFQRLGSSVTIIENRPGILEADDEELSSMLQDFMEDEGVSFILGSHVSRVVSAGPGSVLEIEHGGVVKSVSADLILVAAGRTPNTSDLGLDTAGIVHSATGIETDNRGRTNLRHVYAVGGVTGGLKYTHMAEHSAKVAVLNALLKAPLRLDTKHSIRCTFTDPELAHLGETESELRDSGTDYHVYRFPFSRVDRAVADGQPKGWIKVLARKTTGRILGADILGHRADDQIAHFALAMKNGVTLKQMSDTIHPYPTYAMGNRRTADQWHVQNQSEGLARFVQRAFRLKGPVPNLSDPNRIV